MLPVIIGGVIFAASVGIGGCSGIKAYEKKEETDELLRKLENRIKTNSIVIVRKSSIYKDFLKIFINILTIINIAEIKKKIVYFFL